jgi:hypothetical protein
VAALLPMLALLAAVSLGLLQMDRWLSGSPVSRLHVRRRESCPGADRRPLQVVAADLRRLSRQLSLVPAGAPLVRWRALWSAYDAVLSEAADQLEVAHELSDTPLGLARDIERLRLLAALEGAGLGVRG